MADASRHKHPATGDTPASERVDAPDHCPASRAMDLVAHKWTVHILFALHEAGQPVRFGHLQRAVHPITQKELTKRLRALERSGLVHRRVYAEVPPRVEYRLTRLGASMGGPMKALGNWAIAYAEHVESSREHYDAVNA